MSHQTQRLNLSGRVVYLLRWLERESTCFGVMRHLLQDSTPLFTWFTSYILSTANYLGFKGLDPQQHSFCLFRNSVFINGITIVLFHGLVGPAIENNVEMYDDYI